MIYCEPPTNIIVITVLFGAGIIVVAQTYKTVEERNLHENINYWLEGYQRFRPCRATNTEQLAGKGAQQHLLCLFSVVPAVGVMVIASPPEGLLTSADASSALFDMIR